MSRFLPSRSSRRPGPAPGRASSRSTADDPTEVLQRWRDQQRDERLADTREFPEFVDVDADSGGDPGATPVSAPPRRRRVPVAALVGAGALVLVAGVAIASAANRPAQQGAGDVTGGGTASTSGATPSNSASVSPSPSASGGSDGSDGSATSSPAGPQGPAAGGPDGRGGPAAGDGPASGDGPAGAPSPPAGGPDAGPDEGPDGGQAARPDEGPAAGPGADDGPPAPPDRP